MAAGVDRAPTTSRITVNLPTKVWEALRELADKDGLTYTEALRRAISTQVFVRSVLDEGADVCVRRPDGSFERVVFHY
jgi:predicted DNA binding CopG/RHH family protein